MLHTLGRALGNDSILRCWRETVGLRSPGAALGRHANGRGIGGTSESRLPPRVTVNQPTNQSARRQSMLSWGGRLSVCHWARHLQNAENQEGRQSPGERDSMSHRTMALTPIVPSQDLGCCYLGRWGHRSYAHVSPWEICEKIPPFPRAWLPRVSVSPCQLRGRG